MFVLQDVNQVKAITVEVHAMTENEMDDDFFHLQQLNLASERIETTGTFYLATLYQTEYWQDIHGRKHQIVDMESRYIENVLGYLMRNAARFHANQLFQLEVAIGEDLSDGVFAGLSHEIGEMMQEGPFKWMQRTILFLALQAELEKRYLS